MRIRALLREVTHIPLNTKQFTPVDQVVISNLEQPVKRGGGVKGGERTKGHSGSENANAELMRQAISSAALGEGWRGYFEHKLKKMEKGT